MNYGVCWRALRSCHRYAINSLFHAFHTEVWRGQLLGKLKVIWLNYYTDIHSKNNILSSCHVYYRLLNFSPFLGEMVNNLKNLIFHKSVYFTWDQWRFADFKMLGLVISFGRELFLAWGSCDATTDFWWLKSRKDREFFHLFFSK